MTISKQIPVGYTIAHKDGSAIGYWMSWMGYYDTLDGARQKAI